MARVVEWYVCLVSDPPTPIIETMLVYCWYRVVDAVPTLNQYCFNVSQALPDIEPMLYQCAVDGVPHHPCVSNKQDKANVGLMLAHRLRRWPNNNPTLVHCLVFLVTAPCPPGARADWPPRQVRGEPTSSLPDNYKVVRQQTNRRDYDGGTDRVIMVLNLVIRSALYLTLLYVQWFN